MDSLSETLSSSTLTFRQLRGLLENSHVRVSFWGSRLVSADGLKGSVNLAILAMRINSLTGYWSYPSIQISSLRDRLDGIKIARKLEKYYQQTDQMRKMANLITRFLGFLQELFNIQGDSNIWLYTNRFSIGGGCTNYIIVSKLQNIPKGLFEASFPHQEVPRTWFNYEEENFIVSDR